MLYYIAQLYFKLQEDRPAWQEEEKGEVWKKEEDKEPFWFETTPFVAYL